MRDVSAWAPLLPVAMVGTDRDAGPLPAWPGPVGAAIAALAAADRDDGDRAASDVLRAAGILAVCGLAGAQPQARAPGAAAAGPDTLPAPSDPLLQQWLAWTLREGLDQLKQAYFLHFAQAGLRLPHALLPQALELGRTSVAMRPLVQPLLGERGVWLARQREEWRFAAGVASVDGSDPRLWDEGTLEQRKAFLAAERARDPGAARERLAAALPELPAKERAELARGLAAGLSPEDEPLLDQLRGDRGQDVRAVALDLLLRLPDAAHPRRAAARVAALLSNAGAGWTIEPPAQAAADWKADQIDPDVPKGTMGQRAWWLYQLVRQVPLAWWMQHMGLDARAVSDWARSTEWGNALWRGWRDVLRRAPHAGWAALLLDDEAGPAGYAGTTVHADRELALEIVSREVREQWVLRQLASSQASLSTTLWTVASRCGPGETISASLAGPIVDRVRQALALDTSLAPGTQNVNVIEQESVGRLLPELCCTLPLESLAGYDDWVASPTETAATGRARQSGRQIIQARRVLATFFP